MLKAVREAMIRPDADGREGWCRNNANRAIGRLKSVFKWGVENEIVPPHVYQALAVVAGLRRGKTEARETEAVKPVPAEMVDAVLPFLPDQVAAIVKLQRMTAARGGELLKLRGRDIDRSGAAWKYRPADHKTAHHGKGRLIVFNPDAQEVLKPFLDRDPAPTSSPRPRPRPRGGRRSGARRP